LACARSARNCLANFHRVANSVALSGPRRGFIDIPVWRDRKDNEPYNAN
jgi:hypothetical protein